MGTAEIIIVFSALMALIALVTIGIDWIGKPLKNRRFIPRMYRFEDEKVPIDEYGNATFDVPYAPPAAAAHPYPAAPATFFPPVAAPMPGGFPAAAAAITTTEVTEATATQLHTSSTRAKTQPAPRQVARVEHSVAGSQSAFSDSLATPGDLIASSDGATTVSKWEPGMALDTTVNDHKPNLAVKAERFWMYSAQSVTTSHFDSGNRARMSEGKAPRRNNPRTGRTETMVLTGLREASQPAEVRMRWPEEAVDPWSGQ